jgi:hypothetical protein
MTRTSSSTQMADNLVDQRDVRSVALSGDYHLADTCRVQPVAASLVLGVF